ncbi:CoA transferase [Burkholderia sp. Ax-1719]|uniref:CoA transferase n=1 Tax=Burkholderia sp. Ax-1719 TaxID=2608334 RepID=UPI00141DA48C|nr:CoA transferase [Burkholderia sp. Ax-1719]NIE63095.1 2-methylfumaryl-CoA isomerase [Burkholderia sp. Ax-1719]
MSLELLSGIRVVESSAFIAAPLAGMTLAQAGADVIRIDLPGGGIDYARLPVLPAGRSLYWTGLNKGKRSLAVDIRRPEGRAIVQELVTAPGGNSGVMLTNIGGKWLSHETLSAIRSDVITCTIEGNQDGSTAVDYTVNCAAGFPYMTGNADVGEPVNHSLPAWDIACAFQAAFGIAAAVGRRDKTGCGAELRLALSDVAFSMLSHLGLATEAELLHEDRPALGNFLYGAFGKDFTTRDGRRIFVAGISSNQWKNLVIACGIEDALREIEITLSLDFSKEGDRFKAREEIAEIIARWTETKTYADVTARFDEQGVCWGPYQSVQDALRDDPRMSEKNPIFSRITTKGIGSHLVASSPIRQINAKRAEISAAPVLGEHTDEILLEILRLDSGAVGRLHDAGIIAGPEKDPLFPVPNSYVSRNPAA